MSGARLQYLTENDWVLIRARAERRAFGLGEQIIRQGDLGKSFYVIRKGEASVEVASSGGRTILAWLGPEDVCGDMAFLEQGRYSAAVVAKDEEVEIDEINAHHLRELLQDFPGLASRFYQSLALVLVRRLKVTSAELAREMAQRDR